MGGSTDLGLSLGAAGRGRLHVDQAANGLAAAIRVLPGAPPALADLGMPLPLDSLVDLPHGLVLFCGATGSGKSTTLAALAQEALRRRPAMLITLEDPIEYVLSPRGARGVCASVRWGVTSRISRPVSATRSARTRTSSSSARCATPRPSASP